MNEKQKGEKKLLNLFDIFSLGLGGAVGSGIFVLMGLGIGFTGRSIVVAVTVGCVFMLLAYFYNVLLGSMFVFKGGDYSQKALLFNPVLTGVSAYITFTNGFALAMYAVAMVNYASMVFPGIVPFTKIIAVTIVTLFFAATIKGSKFVALLNSIMTVVLMASIGIFVIMGLPKVGPGYFSGEGFFLNGVPGFFAAISIMGWACQGTTMAPTSMYAVTKNPKRTIPGGIVLITISLAVIYGLMSIVAAGVLPVEQVAGQNLSLVAEEIFPRSIYIVFILGGAVFAIATSLMGGIAMVRYPTMKVAEDGWLPNIFKKTTKNGYPWVTQLLYYLFSILPIIFGFSLDAIVSLVMIPAMLMNVYLNIACIGVVRKYPVQWKKSILHMPKPVIYVICVLSSICAAIVAYNLFVGLKLSEMFILLGILAVCFACSIICIKTGKVSRESLQENRRQILEEAMQSEKEEEAAPAASATATSIT